jgi:hypothetical protein
MQKIMKFGQPIGKFCLMLLVIFVGFAVQGCGSAKRGHVKAKNTGCNCGF